jgi:LPXTG-site transpeptidase (sortase) family protein
MMPMKFQFKTFGKVLVALALTILIVLVQPLVFALNKESAERLSLLQNLKFLPPSQKAKVAPDLPPLNVSPVSEDFSLVIEKIDVNVSVVENTDLVDEKTYMEAMRRGAAHGKGTSLPGERGISFIFGHSSFNYLPLGPYNSIFNHLDKLEKGDRLTLLYQGQRFDYLVYETVIITPTEVNHVTEKTDEPILVVAACYPVGTTEKRILIKARLVV